jgi:hypothetical protein
MTTEETAGLREIRRKRTWIWFWVLSYVPAVWTVRHVFHSSVADTVVIAIWAAGFVRSIARGMFCRCPRCAALFFSTHGSPTIWNLFAGKCMQCGLPLKPERVIYPSLE